MLFGIESCVLNCFANFYKGLVLPNNDQPLIPWKCQNFFSDIERLSVVVKGSSLSEN